MEKSGEEKYRDIESFLDKRGWLKDASAAFLAAGEYNENYLIRTDTNFFVFRINRGSQLGIDNQIEYEYSVLEALVSSGVAPRPFHVCPFAEEFDAGVLLMEYLPGRTLDYHTDVSTAADIFSKIHSVPLDKRLLRQDDPVDDIIRECELLLSTFDDHPLERARTLLLRYRDKLRNSYPNSGSLFSSDELSIVNTEVNSGNFIIGDEKSYLVDWEKAVVSCPYQDLAHFSAPTTTLWKSDFVFDSQGLYEFYKEYHTRTHLRIGISELADKAEILRRVILLRGLSWCHMAYYEYSKSNRTLRNEDTFEKIRMYMDEIEWFLR